MRAVKGHVTNSASNTVMGMGSGGTSTLHRSMVELAWATLIFVQS